MPLLLHVKYTLQKRHLCSLPKWQNSVKSNKAFYPVSGGHFQNIGQILNPLPQNSTRDKMRLKDKSKNVQLTSQMNQLHFASKCKAHVHKEMGIRIRIYWVDQLLPQFLYLSLLPWQILLLLQFLPSQASLFPRSLHLQASHPFSSQHLYHLRHSQRFS